MAEELTKGSSISHYRVVSKIGAGGMGEVYRAHDSRLDREVAIKMLPADFANDDDRLRRFEQEAKATSALNHPNILTVFDIGEHHGTPFIVAELLAGEELRDRINEGPIPLRKTLDYAQQIVSGLSAAHEKGIVHRDLKPENLFVTDDDRVKILDFGLAKLREPKTNIHGSEDATRKALTDPGVVMGTVGYMSPEQVRGQVSDQRSDIFAFGVILYEMLTGRPAFRGESVVETMHAILKEDVPDLDEDGPRVPPALEKLMRRCLEKKPEHRFHSAHDLGFALDALASPTSSSGSGMTTTARSMSEDVPAGSSTNWVSRAAWAAAGLFLISTLIFGALYFRRIEPQSQTMRFAIFPPEKNTFSHSFALSPDGQQIAFATIGGTGSTLLWVRPIASVDARQLAGTEGASFPFWSPDSRSIGFFSAGKLRKIDAAGGASQTLADASADPRGGAWAPDGTIIFSPSTTAPLMRVPASGGTASELTKLSTDTAQTSHRWPSMLPDGRHFLYFGRAADRLSQQGLYVASLDAPEGTFLVATPVTGIYTETNGAGYLLFFREATLMAQRFDAKNLSLSGEATPLIQGVLTFPSEVGPTAYSAISAAAGHLIYRTGDQQTTRLTWFDRAGKSLGPIGDPAGYHEPSLSKDGTKVLFGRSEGAEPGDIYLQDLSRGNMTRLTFDPSVDATSIFSPDETQVIFYSSRDGKGSFYRKPATGAGSDELVMESDGGSFPDSWSPDGKYLLYEKNGGAKTKIDLWLLPLTGEGKPFPYLETDFEEAHAQFSPDGRWIAYTSNESGKAEVYVQSFPIGGGKWQVSTTGGDQPQWRSDGKELFYISLDRNLMAVSIGGGSTLAVGRPEQLFQTITPASGVTDDRNNFVPSHDAQRFLVNTLADTTSERPLLVVLNWANDLRK
ncbi:MAG: protein kinase [Pyrinomonadaceae bacterium]